MWWLFIRDFYTAGQSSVDNSPRMAVHYPRCSWSPPSTPAHKPSPINPSIEPQKAAWSALLPYLHHASNSGLQAFALWRSEGGLQLVSENWGSITGISDDLSEGQAFLMAIDAADQYALHNALLLAESEQREASLMVRTCANATGEARHLFVCIAPKTNQRHYVMLVACDMTEHAMLRETIASLQQNTANHSAFLSSMSHELRTPLNAIMGFAEMMRDGVMGKLNNPTYEEYVSHIHESGEHLLAKIDDLLSLSALDSGQCLCDTAPIDLRSMLHNVREIHSDMALSKHVTIGIDMLADYTIMGDRRHLHTVFSHLLRNAITHATAGTSVQLAVRMQGKEDLVIAVRDEGCGISDAQLASIRSALRAKESAANIQSGGVGIGLALSKELLALHDASIRIESVHGQGTIVSACLPSARVRPIAPAKRTPHLTLAN
jgi:signal transduction histidine kinase